MRMIELPNHCDESSQFLFWSFDDVTPIVGMFLLGFMLEHIILFTASGFFLARMLARFREKRADLYFLHALYWWGVGAQRGLSMGNAFKRDFYS